MIGLVLAFGLLMALRKDLYVLIAFHFLATANSCDVDSLIETGTKTRAGQGGVTVNLELITYH